MIEISRNVLNKIYLNALNRSPDPSAITSYLSSCDSLYGKLKVWKSVISSSESRMLPDIFKRAIKSFPLGNSGKGPRIIRTESDGLVFFTIISKNYLAYANTLMQSVKDVHPNCPRYLCLVDNYDQSDDFRTDLYDVVLAKDLEIPNADAFFFRYEIMELNTAVKPYMFKYLIEKNENSGICYLDPDLFLLRPLTEVKKLVDRGASLVLTPHLNDLVNDNKQPSELAIMRSGVYNCGFVVLGKGYESQKIADWWAKKLEYHCFVDLEAGLFTDQKWMDLAPGLFKNVNILRDDGYNLAYWNLAQRKVKKNAAGDYSVNGVPLTFVHFSGISLDKPNIFSKHQNRFTVNDIGDLADLYYYYLAKLDENGHTSLSKSRYAYGYFENGEVITKWHRLAYRKYFDANSSEFIKNPFISDTAIFAEQTPELPRNPQLRVSLLMIEIWKSRVDLQKAFDLTSDAGREQFIVWYLGTREVSIDISHNRIIHDCFDGNIDKPVYGVVNGVATQLQNRGLNLVGYAMGEFGVAENVRSYAKALAVCNYPFVIRNFDVGVASRAEDESMKKYFSNDLPYEKTVFFVNADQMQVVKDTMPAAFIGRRNIGFWVWELDEFPSVWPEAFSIVDEIWVPTEFIKNAISKKTKLPIHVLPKAIEPSIHGKFSKKDFKLRNNDFMFMYSFDFNSFVQRKNPIAVVNAFNKAFDDRDNAILYLKSINGHRNPEAMSEILKLIAGNKKVIVSDGFISRNEMSGLQSICDCYVSLHRAEGFGLGLAECMYFEKPVIATNFSGNTEFMNNDNSCLVDYKLVKINNGEYPYSEGCEWADADVGHAAGLMKKIYSDEHFRKKISSNAKEYMCTYHSKAVCGNSIIARLDDLS